MLPSGKFVLRLKPLNHQRLKSDAETHGVSLNRWIEMRLSASGAPAVSAPVVDSIRSSVAGVDAVVLFGSSVRGEARADSDVDLLIVLNRSVVIQRSLYNDWDHLVAPVLGELYSPQFSHLPEINSATSLWLEVAVEGEILFAVNDGVKDYLRGVRARIADGQFVRKWSHGHSYWVDLRNSDAK